MLKEYEEKRSFAHTPEPAPQPGSGEGPLRFIVQKHAARRLHYDFRLELDGVLKSWSLPNGPSLDPGVKRLAVMVEDHPLDYVSFEGVIPRGEYGAGEVIVWDAGTYSPDEHGKPLFDDRARAQDAMRGALARGKASVFLHGHKLRGSWALVKMQHRENDWLLIKHRDDFAEPERDILKEETSIISGLGITDLKAGHLPRRSDPISAAEIPGSREAPFPGPLPPMLATPTDAPFSSRDWVFEPKLDGFRTLAFVSGGEVALYSRRQLNVTGEYPFIIEGLKAQPVTRMVLDGEIVALDEAGRPCFQCLQQRHERSRQTEPIAIVYYVFDILYMDSYDLGSVPLEQRRRLLERVLAPSEHVRLIEQFQADGQKVYEAAVAMGFEGVIAKRGDSIYEPGRRSRSWLKVKAIHSDEFVIGGFTEGTGNRSSTFGALLLGYYDSGRLAYAGHVGSGFDDTALTSLRRRLDELRSDECPFAETPPRHGQTIWVRPELVAEVKFTQWTQDGYLRSPVFLRLREDKAPSEVGRIRVVSHPTSAPPAQAEFSGIEELKRIQGQIESAGDSPTIEVEGHRIGLTNLGKALWPPYGERAALTKRDLLIYLLTVSPYLLPHLRDRPLTLTRYPDGIHGERFYQKHWEHPLPEFVDSVRLFSEHEGDYGEYLLCNNLSTLLWLGQIADIEIHTWFSRVSPKPDLAGVDSDLDYLAEHPDFIIFDLDPYIYSGREPVDAEPELNRAAFDSTCEVALWLKEVLDSLSLSSFVKTSGRTGLHVHVPLLRQFDYRAIRSAAGTVGSFLSQQHPGRITSDWAVEKRTGKVFFDYNQNVRGKTLASVYSPRPTPAATVSTPLAWDDLGKIYPTDFTILTVPGRLSRTGDLWASILNARGDLKKLLELA